MWVSLPVDDREFSWIQEMSDGWRRSKEELWRQSGVELAVVLPAVWKKWELPEPAAPIVSLDVSDFSGASQALARGAVWAKAPADQAWGVTAGLLRFPSGLYVELIKRRRGGS